MIRPIYKSKTIRVNGEWEDVQLRIGARETAVYVRGHWFTICDCPADIDEVLLSDEELTATSQSAPVRP